jgi:hypothetical protein
MALTGTGPSWLAEIAAASPEALGFTMLEADPHARRLDRPTQLTAVRGALADGAATAKALRARFPALAPPGIAHALGVPIETVDEDPMVGSLWRFAEYRARPTRIVLYSRGLAPIDNVAKTPLALQLLGPATPQDVFIAHELFHHAEATRPDVPIARRYQATLFRIGGLSWRTGLAALSEIAAGAFAQGLLDLPCHPRVLDLLVLDAVSAQAAAIRIAARIASARMSCL